MFKDFFTAMLLVLIATCQGSLVECYGGKKSRIGYCAAEDPDERSLRALQESDFETAIAILEPLIEAEPELYERYPRLAVAYASLGSFKIADIVESIPQGGDPVQAIEGILPVYQGREEAYTVELAWMDKALVILRLVPDETVVEDSNLGRAIRFQLRLYQAAYSLMHLRKFATDVGASVGQASYTEDSLRNLSDQDVDVILGNLQAAAAVAGTDSGEIEVQKKLDEFLIKIESAPGQSKKEKLIAHFSKKTPTDVPVETSSSEQTEGLGNE